MRWHYKEEQTIWILVSLNWKKKTQSLIRKTILEISHKIPLNLPTGQYGFLLEIYFIKLIYTDKLL
jgi:hypothetical protein